MCDTVNSDELKDWLDYALNEFAKSLPASLRTEVPLTNILTNTKSIDLKNITLLLSHLANTSILLNINNKSTSAHLVDLCEKLDNYGRPELLAVVTAQQILDDRDSRNVELLRKASKVLAAHTYDPLLLVVAEEHGPTFYEAQDLITASDAL